jgi:hypothetical protein
MEKPYYLINFESYVCNVQIELNGALVIKEVKGLPNNFLIPVNDAILTGANTLKIKMTSRDGQPFNSETKVRVKIILTDDNSEKGRQTVNQWDAPHYNIKEDPKTEDDHTILFEARQPYSNPEWTNGGIIDLSDANVMARLTQKMNSIYLLFRAKDTEGLLEVFDFRNKEFANSHYFTYEERIQDVENGLRETFGDTQLQLLDYNFKYLVPRIYGRGKLFTLEDEEGYPGIIYVDTAAPKYTSFPVYLSINNQDEIYVSR